MLSNNLLTTIFNLFYHYGILFVLSRKFWKFKYSFEWYLLKCIWINNICCSFWYVHKLIGSFFDAWACNTAVNVRNMDFSSSAQTLVTIVLVLIFCNGKCNRLNSTGISDGIIGMRGNSTFSPFNFPFKTIA